MSKDLSKHCEPKHNCKAYAELEAENAELRERLADVENLNKKLIEFVDTAIEIAFEGCDYEGADIQDFAHKLGLLEIKVMQEPCGEHCNCLAFDADFPNECYRRVDLSTKQIGDL